jgi:SAM-dependent methyltransferase
MDWDSCMAGIWWEEFFDDDYIALWSEYAGPEQTERAAAGLWSVLRLSAGQRILDAPCGWGRLSVALARRGATVVGVDQSATLLAHAERTRGDLSIGQLRYRRHDLRQPLDESGFDVAINIFSSIGYGTEADDGAIFRTLGAAVRPGGLVFVETMHRDLAVRRLAQGPPGVRHADGTLVVETPRFDGIAGRSETTWHWAGPRGSGQKSASLRIYSATELVRLIEGAGLTFLSAHKGCSPEPFSPFEGRLGLLYTRP